MPGVAQVCADRGGAAVLPDDGVVNGPARVTIPDQRRFTLVGDADGGNVGGGDPGPFDHRAAGGGGG